jgi:ABC-type polar amino acid transport system ATPase subunit
MQLTIKNIQKSIENLSILKDFSLSISSGEIAILLGKSGAGKSTILRILNNLEIADSGKIALNNAPIKKNEIGFVFQNFNLFSNLSVIENITLALVQVKNIKKEEAFAMGCDILKKYHLLDKKDSSVQSLSGGQKQRIAIIRTLVMQPKIICFDEPISSLDPYSTNEILSFIRELQREDYIILMTTHNVSILNQLDCIIHLLHNGSIIEIIDSYNFFNKENKNSYLYKFINGIL